MSEQSFAELRGRVGQLEGAMHTVIMRLQTIETDLRKAARSPEPAWPPIPPPVVAFSREPVPPTPLSPVMAAPKFDVSAEPKARADVEYQIGAKFLPRVGAVMVLLAVLFFVAWRYSQGLIPPGVVFAGEVLFCLAFVGAGLYKRNEREDFGQLLMGVGSSGLFLSLAGGHLVHKLYSAELLVAMFFGLSLVNLGVCLWRSSKSFLAIGVLGGIAAALMPTDRGNFVLNVVLHFGILVPSVAIVWKNRWADSAMLLWVVSSLALIPAVDSRLGWIFGTSVLGASTILCVAGFSVVWDGESRKKKPAFIPVAIAITAMSMDSVMSRPEGGWAVLAFSALLVGTRWLPGVSQSARLYVLLSGLALALYYAPFFLTTEQSQFVFIALALALSVLAIVKRSTVVLGLSAIDLGIGLIQYAGFVASHNETVRVDLTMLAFTVASVVVLTIAARRVTSLRLREVANATGLSVIASLLVRAVFVVFTAPGLSLRVSPEIASLLGFVSVALVGMAIGGPKRDKTLVGIGAVGSLICFFVVAGMFDLHPQGWPEIGCLVGVLACYGITVGTVRRVYGSQPLLEAAIACLGWMTFSRLAFVTPAALHRHTDSVLSTSVAWIAYAVLLIVVGFAWSVQSLRYVSLAVFGATVGKVLLVDMANTDPAIRVCVFLALGLAMLAGGNAYIRRHRTQAI